MRTMPRSSEAFASPSDPDEPQPASTSATNTSPTATPEILDVLITTPVDHDDRGVPTRRRTLPTGSFVTIVEPVGAALSG